MSGRCEGCGCIGGTRLCNRCYVIEQKINTTGKEHCWICGKSVEECDKVALELGFDECEMLAK